MKFINFMNRLLTNLIPPKMQSWPKFLAGNLCSKSHIFLNTSWIPANEGSKFKLDCVELENKKLRPTAICAFTLLCSVFIVSLPVSLSLQVCVYRKLCHYSVYKEPTTEPWRMFA